MDCCKDTVHALIVKTEHVDLIGSILIEANIIFREQFELIKQIQSNKTEINLLTFQADSIASITSLLAKNGINSFLIRKQFK